MKKNSLRRRWSCNDRYFGPFTFARDRSARIGVMLDTGDDEYGGASIRMHAPGFTFIVAMPSVLPLGREYGATVAEGALHVRYGPQTMDSSTEKSKCWFLPWMNWRHVRTSLYGLSGEHLATRVSMPWAEWYEIEQTCPSVTFAFTDFDGEQIHARTYIEEMEWRLGRGWFRWLSVFRSPRVRRSLDIKFSEETGRRKGSWKGGTVGHSIDMRSGELHESAFRRYCGEHEMRFIAEVDPLSAPSAPSGRE